jgi:hypothetical protein
MTHQDTLMKFDPKNRNPYPYPSHAWQYRKWHGLTAWIYNPWTGRMRYPEYIGSDIEGLLIIPENEVIK